MNARSPLTTRLLPVGLAPVAVGAALLLGACQPGTASPAPATMATAPSVTSVAPSAASSSVAPSTASSSAAPSTAASSAATTASASASSTGGSTAPGAVKPLVPPTQANLPTGQLMYANKPNDLEGGGTVTGWLQTVSLCKRNQGTPDGETAAFLRQWSALGEGPSAQAFVVGYGTTAQATAARKELLSWYAECTPTPPAKGTPKPVTGVGDQIPLPAEVRGKADVVEAVAVRARTVTNPYTNNEDGILIQVGNRLLWAHVGQISAEPKCAVTASAGVPQCTVYANAGQLAALLAA